ncbi:MAG: leucine--tRNA ligase [Phycisphaera sp.]|nr:leucine--tRNA ligase [Phycisphaera sp.]
MSNYDHTEIEARWQEYWASNQTFRVGNPGDAGFDASKPKYYVLDMFPYPSGVGLHVGHPLGYIATDIVARYKRMRGFNVLHPMGFDAFGLPAEQFAVEHGVHPRVTTEQNIDNMTRQLRRLGLSYDWDRCISTTDVDYYKWTQWIFLQLYNSWFDPSVNRARPISELIARLRSGEIDVSIDGGLVDVGASGGLDAIGGAPIGARKWHELDATQQEALLAEYRLAYLAEVPVNWCPALGTVLANEEVTNEGRSERGNHPVFKRPLRQWMLRITTFADRLADDLEMVAWPEAIKSMQRYWIGRSEGAHVEFRISDLGSRMSQETIRVYTTRPDTLFGATYMVLAPEHPLVDELVADEWPEGTPESWKGGAKSEIRNPKSAIAAYRAEAEARSDVDRMAETKTKTGVFTGATAINPVNGQAIPIWIADYVLMGYGTGAIMAVPAHDQRDMEFAKRFRLPIKPVVMPSDDWFRENTYEKEPGYAELSDEQWKKSLHSIRGLYSRDPDMYAVAFTGAGESINSANSEISIDGLHTPDAKRKITAWLDEKGVGSFKVQYKLRDWLFSRQRYWGEPFPILHELDADGKHTGRIRAVDAGDLPVELPPMDDFSPTSSDDPNAPPRPPLARSGDEWRIVEIDGVKYERELNTMPQWAGSCWYYLRFIDNRNDDRFVGQAAEDYWMVSEKKSGGMHAGGVDLYVGGAEHAVLHLLYARFWHKVLFDLGHVSTPEPFGKLFNQGYIQAYSYQDERGIYRDATKVEARDGKYFIEGDEVTRSLGKMGKSLKNAVSPDEMCEQHGCDTLRLYEMYMGPLDQSKPWETQDIVGLSRFVKRVWRNFVNVETGDLLVNDDAPSEDQLRALHKTIAKVTDDMERMSYNTAIASLIELNNALVQAATLPRAVAEPFVLMLAPMAPHLAEELWRRMGHDGTIAYESWPAVDQKYLVEDEVELPVQINGKVRARIKVASDADKDAIEQAVLADAEVQKQIDGKTVRKTIVVPGRMVNIVAN